MDPGTGPGRALALADWLPMLCWERRAPKVSRTPPRSTSRRAAIDRPLPDRYADDCWAWLDDDVVLLARKSGEGMTDTEVALILSDADERLGQTTRTHGGPGCGWRIC